MPQGWHRHRPCGGRPPAGARPGIHRHRPKEGAKLHGGEALARPTPTAPRLPAPRPVSPKPRPRCASAAGNRWPRGRHPAREGLRRSLALANDTPFGLASSIATSLKHATHFKRHARRSMVMVNLPTAGVDYHVPFGGRKGSSYGSREQGRYAAEFYTTVRRPTSRPDGVMTHWGATPHDFRPATSSEGHRHRRVRALGLSADPAPEHLHFIESPAIARHMLGILPEPSWAAWRPWPAGRHKVTGCDAGISLTHERPARLGVRLIEGFGARPARCYSRYVCGGQRQSACAALADNNRSFRLMGPFWMRSLACTSGPNGRKPVCRTRAACAGRRRHAWQDTATLDAGVDFGEAGRQPGADRQRAAELCALCAAGLQQRPRQPRRSATACS